MGIIARLLAVSGGLIALSVLLFQMSMRSPPVTGSSDLPSGHRAIGLLRAAAGFGVAAIMARLAIGLYWPDCFAIGSETSNNFKLSLLQAFALLVIALFAGWRYAAMAAAVFWVLLQIAAGLSSVDGFDAFVAASPMFSSVSLLASVIHVFGAACLLSDMIPKGWAVAAARSSGSMGASRTRLFARVGSFGFLTAGLYQSCYFLVVIPGLLGTGYVSLVIVKLLLLATSIALWLRWRQQLTVAADAAAQSIPVLTRQMAVIAGVLAASVLLNAWGAPPQIQPFWPFAWTVSLDIAGNDPVFRIEVLRSLPWLAGAALLLLIAVLPQHFWRRLRWLALALAAVTIWWKSPDLNPIIVPAYPTTYYHSPTRFAAASILRGQEIYPEHCAGCHGREGRGDGERAGELPRAPADLTADHLWMHSDGELFWWLSHGMNGQDGTSLMPGFAQSLSADDLWSIIDYVRARNAGLARTHKGRWSPTVLAPNFPIVCADGQQAMLADLRGRAVRIAIGTASASKAGITTVAITDDRTVKAAPGLCRADGSAAQGYAIVAGLTGKDIENVQFLVDPSGWLRALQKPASKGGWNDPQMLANTIWLLTVAPISGSTTICHAAD